MAARHRQLRLALAAALDRYGKAVCSEGCEPGSAARCVRPK
jgi:hypothetical protein